MSAKNLSRPNEEALRSLLDAHVFDTVGATVRLAWWAGLERNEIAALTWDRVSFLNE